MDGAERAHMALVAGSLLRHSLDRLKLYQEDVAQRARLARSTVAELELGSRPLRPHQVEALARALDLDDDKREELLALADRSLGTRRMGPPGVLDAERERAADLYRPGMGWGLVGGPLLPGDAGAIRAEGGERPCALGTNRFSPSIADPARSRTARRATHCVPSSRPTTGFGNRPRGRI